MNVTEGTFPPVTTMREHELVPRAQLYLVLYWQVRIREGRSARDIEVEWKIFVGWCAGLGVRDVCFVAREVPYLAVDECERPEYTLAWSLALEVLDETLEHPLAIIESDVVDVSEHAGVG